VQPCAELRPDDGVDPRILFRRETRTRSQARKVGQLCKHALRVFSLVLAELASEEWSDEEWASGLVLAGVAPAPDTARLRVTIAFLEPCPLEHAERALEHLRARSGLFRWELAESIRRKRAPELVFGLAAPGGDPRGGGSDDRGDGVAEPGEEGADERG
jgi:ribosome-binding factor A